MPHVKIEMFPGRSEEMKKELAKAITESVTSVLGASESSVSVAIEDVSEKDWDSKVYDKEILNNQDKLYKRPGYGVLVEGK